MDVNSELCNLNSEKQDALYFFLHANVHPAHHLHPCGPQRSDDVYQCNKTDIPGDMQKRVDLVMSTVSHRSHAASQSSIFQAVGKSLCRP
jgi:hypothetical protein